MKLNAIGVDGERALRDYNVADQVAYLGPGVAAQLCSIFKRVK